MFQKASQFMLTKDFEFVRINCLDFLILCQTMSITDVPLIQLYYQGKLQRVNIDDQIDNLLEKIDKISNSPIVDMTDLSLLQFSNNHGESSFIIVDKNYSNSTIIHSCLVDFINSKYRNRVYIGIIRKPYLKLISDGKIDSPSIIASGLNLKYKIHRKFEKCVDLQEFIEENAFPLVRNIDHYYLNELNNYSKTSIILVISKITNGHKELLEEILLVFAKSYRKYIFGYVDIDHDQNLLKDLNANVRQCPYIIIYQNGKRFVHEKIIEDSSDAYNILNYLIQEIDNNRIIFNYGNRWKDFLDWISDFSNQKIFFGVFTVFNIAIFIFVIFYLKTGEIDDQIIKNK